MPAKPTIPRVCEVCRKDFLVVAFKVREGKGRFCSPECRYQSQRQRKVYRCETCGAEFTITPSEERRGRGRYCSPPCFYKDYKKPASVRFWRHVDKGGGSGCWLWTA